MTAVTIITIRVATLFLVTSTVIARTTAVLANLRLGKERECKFTVRKESAEYFSKWLKLLDGMVAHLEIAFTNNVTFNTTEDILFSNKWLWTFVPPGGGRFYISWPVDYSIDSFGLLDAKSLKKTVTLYMNVSIGCKIRFGETQTVKRIANSLYHMSLDYNFSKINDFYEYSYWCYVSKRSEFNLHKDWNIYLGVPLQLFGYKCCYNSFEKKQAICNTKEIIWNSYNLVPFYIGIIFFIYFPLIVMKFGHRAISAGKNTLTSDTEYSNIEDNDIDFVFLKEHGPISISKLFLSLFGLADIYPVLASRIRRILFVCCTPIVVYTSLILYKLREGGQEMIDELVAHKVPYGFISIIGGLGPSMDMFLPMFGGPGISLCLYTVIGFVIVLVPKKLSEVVLLGLPADQYNFSTLLKLDVATIERFSKKECRHVVGYRKVYSVMRGNLYMLINPQFWCYTFAFFLTRWKSAIGIFCPCNRGRIFKIAVELPVLIVYTCLCVIETVLVMLYNGFPVCFFVVSTFRGYGRYFRRSQRGQRFLFYVILSIFFPVCFLIFMFMLIMISLQSFITIGYFIFFIYLSLIIFPGRSFGYVYYVIMFILYVHNLVKDFEQEYKDLLVYTIKASKKMERDSLTKYLINNTANKSVECCMTDFLTAVNIIPSGMNRPHFSIQKHGTIEYLRYRQQIPGVPSELFSCIINKFRPVHIAFFHFVVQILVVQVLVLASIIFISTYIKNQLSTESSEVLNVMSTIIVTMIPNIIRIFFLKNHTEKLRKRKVLQSVIDFWEMKRKAENEKN